MDIYKITCWIFTISMIMAILFYNIGYQQAMHENSIRTLQCVKGVILSIK